MGFGEGFYVVRRTDPADTDVVLVGDGEQVFFVVDPGELDDVVHAVEFCVDLATESSVGVDGVETELVLTDDGESGAGGGLGEGGLCDVEGQVEGGCGYVVFLLFLGVELAGCDLFIKLFFKLAHGKVEHAQTGRHKQVFLITCKNPASGNNITPGIGAIGKASIPASAPTKGVVAAVAVVAFQVVVLEEEVLVLDLGGLLVVGESLEWEGILLVVEVLVLQFAQEHFGQRAHVDFRVWDVQLWECGGEF